MKKELSKSFLLLKTSIKKHSPEILMLGADCVA